MQDLIACSLGKRTRKLEFDYVRGRNEKVLVIVKNFSGLDAEMDEHGLRAMAEQLIQAADKLASTNN